MLAEGIGVRSSVLFLRAEELAARVDDHAGQPGYGFPHCRAVMRHVVSVVLGWVVVSFLTSRWFGVMFFVVHDFPLWVVGAR